MASADDVTGTNSRFYSAAREIRPSTTWSRRRRSPSWREREPPTMAPGIGVNLRVTGHCHQGGRRYMEDAFAVAYQQTKDESDLEYAYFGIFDGHGGREAALFAKEHLMDFIVGQKNFWSDDDEQVLKAIRDGFLATHMAMWKEVGKWPQTMSGLPSTSGSTASVVFIRNSKLYIGHVGDSAVVLGYKEKSDEHFSVRPLTKDHKPESPMERERIENMGGSVVCKSGVQRVVWNRPRLGHRGPVRRSTHMDQIPFLAVARSLGDLWSYNYFHGEFTVSPEPDVSVVNLSPGKDRCIILGSDGLWNMISPLEAVLIVEEADKEIEKRIIEDMNTGNDRRTWVNPSKLLIDKAISRWQKRKMLADNTSAVTVMLDPPGPPRSEVLKRQHMLNRLRPREEPDPVSEKRESRILVTSMPTTVDAETAKSEPKLQASGESRTKVHLQSKGTLLGGDGTNKPPTLKHVKVLHEPVREPGAVHDPNNGKRTNATPLERCKCCSKRMLSGATCHCLNNCSTSDEKSSQAAAADIGVLKTKSAHEHNHSCDTSSENKPKHPASTGGPSSRSPILRPESPSNAKDACDAKSDPRPRDATPPISDDRFSGLKPKGLSLSSRAANYAKRKFLAIHLQSPSKLLSRTHGALKDKPQLVRQNSSRMISSADLSIPGFLKTATTTTRSPVASLLTRVTSHQPFLKKLKPNKDGQWEIENQVCSKDSAEKAESHNGSRTKRKSTSFLVEPLQKKLRQRSWAGGCVNERILRHCVRRHQVK